MCDEKHRDFCFKCTGVKIIVRNQDGVAGCPPLPAPLTKILPRLAGGSNAVRRILLQLLGWSHNGKNLQDEEVANSICREWEKDGCQRRY